MKRKFKFTNEFKKWLYFKEKLDYKSLETMSIIIRKGKKIAKKYGYEMYLISDFEIAFIEDDNVYLAYLVRLSDVYYDITQNNLFLKENKEVEEKFFNDNLKKFTRIEGYTDLLSKDEFIEMYRDRAKSYSNNLFTFLDKLYIDFIEEKNKTKAILK